MSKQTINIGASPNDGTGTPLRTSFDYCNLNFTELYTATGPSGNNIVVPGNATITGDLTVDTSTLKVDSTNNRVGIGTATPTQALSVGGAVDFKTYVAHMDNFAVYAHSSDGTVLSSFTGYPICFRVANVEQYRIAASGVNTWSDGAGGTRMTLNSTGLGVGIAPDSAKSTRLSVYQTGDLTDETAPLSVGNTAAGGMRLYAGVNNTNEYVYLGSVKSGTGYRSMILQPNGGNVGVGVTPTYRLTIGGNGSSGACTLAFIDTSNSNKEFRIEQGVSELRFVESGNSTPLRIKDSNVVVSEAAIATTATKGFLYIPTCAGTPTGTPATFTGRSPIVVDSTNNKLYFYSGGSWVAAN